MQTLLCVTSVLAFTAAGILWSLSRPDRRPAILQPPPDQPRAFLPQPASPRLTDEVGKHSMDGPTENLSGLRVPISMACMCAYDATKRRVRWEPACPLHGWRAKR